MGSADMPIVLPPSERCSPVELALRASAGNIDDQARAWIAAAFVRFQRGEALERAFGLDRASRIRARDAALVRAAAVLAPAPSTWALAVRLAGAVRRFEVRVAPRLAPGAELPPLDDALRTAFAASVGVPSSARALYDLLC